MTGPINNLGIVKRNIVRADMAAVEKLWEIVSAAVFQCFVQGEVFEPAVGTGYEVEVGFLGIHRGC